MSAIALVTGKNGKHLNGHRLEVCINKLWIILTMGYYVGVKNERARMCINLDNPTRNAEISIK